MLGAERFCKGYPQRCTQNLWVAVSRFGSPVSPMENAPRSISPMRHGQRSGGWQDQKKTDLFTAFAFRSPVRTAHPTIRAPMHQARE